MNPKKKVKRNTKYWFDPKISWRVFKKINDECMKIYLKKVGGDIVVKNFDKIAWQMLRERKINIGINKDGVFLSLKTPPKNAKIISTPLQV